MHILEKISRGVLRVALAIKQSRIQKLDRQKQQPINIEREKFEKQIFEQHGMDEIYNHTCVGFMTSAPVLKLVTPKREKFMDYCIPLSAGKLKEKKE